jgi:hypothetical protein
MFVNGSANICRITTCNERCINRVHLTFSLYTNCQNRPCGKEFNTTAFVNLRICNVNVNIILWWLLISLLCTIKKNIVISMLNCYCRKHLIFLCFLWHWHHGWCSIRYTHFKSLSKRSGKPNIFFIYKLPISFVRKGIQYYSLC